MSLESMVDHDGDDDHGGEGGEGDHDGDGDGVVNSNVPISTFCQWV